MKNLRVLKVDELHINGDFELLSKEPRWLSWQKCPLKCIQSHFPLEKLVVPKLQGSNIQEFGVDLKCCKSLKKLDLSDNKCLVRTPNFNGSLSLETLWLRGCSSLTEIHESIGNLQRLIDLDFYGCKKLMHLPSSILYLKSLRSLGIRWCSSLKTLPVELGEMTALTSLLARDTGIVQLPGSVEMLRDLVTLEVGGRNLEAKRSIISQKRIHRVELLSSNISSLILTHCGFSEADVPRDIGSLSSLIYLNLSGNSFRCLPFDFSKLQLLEYLCLNDCENLQTLPSVSKLQKFWTFEVANCKKLVDVTGLDNLPSIERINMVNCTSLQNPFNEDFFTAPALPFHCRKNPNPGLEIYLQSNVIPDFCSNQVTSSSICFTMATDNEYKFLGMILWCVRKFVKVPTSRGFHPRGLSFNIAGRRPSKSYHWRYDYEIHAKRAELSCVLYRSYLQEPFYGQTMEGGEKMQIVEFGEESTVKKIGIHLLYLDQHGNVTSLPAIIDHSH